VAAGREWLGERLALGDRVLICWPGLTTPPAAGEWLAWLRREKPDELAAHLPYPAPRGEVAADPAEARRLRRHRVLCCLPADSPVDRGDALVCPRCGGRALVHTDRRDAWLACPSCRHEDRGVVLTLNGFRAAAARALFAEYRMARYLTSGTGTRYGGAFARTVLCQLCHRPQVAYARLAAWDRTDLGRLTAALAAAWDGDDREGTLRRATAWAVRQLTRPSPAARAQAEDGLRRLLDAALVVDGRPRPEVDRLARGTSMCCDAPLATTRRPLSRLLVGVERLLTGPAPERHPGLPAGRAGLRALLAAAE
jgi:hypothetical protein